MLSAPALVSLLNSTTKGETRDGSDRHTQQEYQPDSEPGKLLHRVFRLGESSAALHRVDRAIAVHIERLQGRAQLAALLDRNGAVRAHCAASNIFAASRARRGHRPVPILGRASERDGRWRGWGVCGQRGVGRAAADAPRCAGPLSTPGRGRRCACGGWRVARPEPPALPAWLSTAPPAPRRAPRAPRRRRPGAPCRTSGRGWHRRWELGDGHVTTLSTSVSVPLSSPPSRPMLRCAQLGRGRLPTARLDRARGPRAVCQPPRAARRSFSFTVRAKCHTSVVRIVISVCRGNDGRPTLGSPPCPRSTAGAARRARDAAHPMMERRGNVQSHRNVTRKHTR